MYITIVDLIQTEFFREKYDLLLKYYFSQYNYVLVFTDFMFHERLHQSYIFPFVAESKQSEVLVNGILCFR